MHSDARHGIPKSKGETLHRKGKNIPKSDCLETNQKECIGGKKR